ncbi:MAG: c-type cytochrome [Gemmata sp.]
MSALAALLAAGYALALLPGCGGCNKAPDVPPNLAFLPRANRVVLKVPDKPAPALNDPLRRDAEIAALDALGGQTLDPASVPLDPRKQHAAALKDTFGTPAAPTGEVDDAPSLSEGSRLYRRHCQQCHNLSGDGRGPSGSTVPFPRDYRQGQFKFVTTGASAKPRPADLHRTLKDGLKGTPMPSFALLQEGERDLLARYVVYLSVRGQTEFELLKGAATGQTPEAGALVNSIRAEWEAAKHAPPLPPEPDDGEPGSPAHLEAVKRGYTIFAAKADNSCISCHGEYGRKPVLRYDVWGTVARPADLTQRDALKGGSRPEDVYARVRFGVRPVGMPAHPKLTEREVWDLVRFVRALPYPAQLPDAVRSAVNPAGTP